MSKDAIVKQRVKTVSVGSIVLGRKAIIKMLQNATGPLALADGVPNDAKVVFRVPGGGDWSGEDCELSEGPGYTKEERGLLEISWNEEKIEEG